MLLFTDELVERRGRPMASSLTQLAEILADLAQAPLEHLVADMVERMGAASERDDVAVLAVRARLSAGAVRARCQTVPVTAPTLDPDNPLARASALPYGSPDFASIRVEHIGPAIRAGIAQEVAEVEAIAAGRVARDGRETCSTRSSSPATFSTGP